MKRGANWELQSNRPFKKQRKEGSYSYNQRRNNQSNPKHDFSSILFETKKRKNIKYYNSVIGETAKRKSVKNAFILYDQLKEDLEPNQFTFATLINACSRAGRLDLAENVVQDMKEYHVPMNEVIYTTIIKGHVDCLDDLKTAMAKLEEMKESGFTPNLRTYNTLLRGCMKTGDYKTSKILMKEIKESGEEPNIATYVILTKIQASHFKTSKALKTYKKLAKIAERIDVSVYYWLVTMLTLQGEREEAKKFLKLYEPLCVDKSSIEDLDSIKRYLELDPEKVEVYPHGMKGSVKVLEVDPDTQRIKFKQFKFPSRKNPINMEICSGNGEWVISRAREESEQNWLSVERRSDRVATIWSKIALNSLNNAAVLSGDAVDALRALPSKKLNSLYVHFPDPPYEDNPDPLFTEEFVTQICRTLASGSKLHVLTDDENYKSLIFSSLQRDTLNCIHNGEMRQADETYEHFSFFDDKFKQKGRVKRFYLCFEKK
eukprot:TRINITY_DN9015_c0_g1_i1.p1 TRINITY_DN9015_c0_g1~~TRINITY_DN9015_c0_g1_i1.p1  ORF type:complete len:488 (-),score=113.16 TRINITY_DN9015_c0_g1_i1:12-1475(-)